MRKFMLTREEEKLKEEEEKKGEELIIATNQGNTTAVRDLLFKKRVNIDYQSKVPATQEDTALLIAVRKKNEELIKILLYNDADITIADDRGESAPVYARGFDPAMYAFLKTTLIEAYKKRKIGIELCFLGHRMDKQPSLIISALRNLLFKPNPLQLPKPVVEIIEEYAKQVDPDTLQKPPSPSSP